MSDMYPGDFCWSARAHDLMLRWREGVVVKDPADLERVLHSAGSLAVDPINGGMDPAVFVMSSSSL